MDKWLERGWDPRAVNKTEGRVQQSVADGRRSQACPIGRPHELLATLHPPRKSRFGAMVVSRGQ